MNKENKKKRKSSSNLGVTMKMNFEKRNKKNLKERKANETF